MTTKMELLSTIEDIELDILVALKRPTIMQRLKFFLSQKTVSSWVAEVAKIRQHAKQRLNSYKLEKKI